MMEIEKFDHKRTLRVAGVGVFFILVIVVGIIASAFFGSTDGKGSNRTDSNAVIASEIDGMDDAQGDITADTRFAAADIDAATDNDTPSDTIINEQSQHTSPMQAPASASFGGVVPTEAPAYNYIPGQSAGDGCYFAENFGGSTGMRVPQGATLPPSSMFEPDFTENELHHYRDGGIAPESGVVWMFVDENGVPANDQCIFNQLQYFLGRDFIQH